MTPNFTPRPSQQNILHYTGGRLGIAAVPGAGKTHILSAVVNFEAHILKFLVSKLTKWRQPNIHPRGLFLESFKSYQALP